MMQEQGLTPPINRRTDTRQHGRSRYFFSALLVSVGVTLLLSLLFTGVLWLWNPFHLPGDSAHLIASLLALLRQSPQLLLIPLLVFIVFFFLAFFSIQPLALVSYLRAVHEAQEGYHKLYTPLTALTNLRQATERYSSEPTVSPHTIQEYVSILDLVQQQNTHQMILGVPGAGKTTALRVYQYLASQQPWQLVFRRGKIPLYVPMKNYSLFLKNALQFLPSDIDATSLMEKITLLDFLAESDLPGMRHLRASLPRLAQQGRLLLLCDGLNEVDSNYLSHMSEELAQLMRDSRNRLVMTCREVDFREQYDFVQLVNEGQASCAVIYPLQPEQVHEFVERYVERQDQRWQHTAGQIVQVIDRSRLRYHCTNPMMLFTLMRIIDDIGVERGKQIDTRGRLLREYVKQLILYEQQQARWSRGAPAERDVVRFLSEIASAARWANDRNAIQLRVTSLSFTEGRRKASLEEWSDELQFWLDEHPARGPFADGDELLPSQPYDDLTQLLQFALSAALVEISPGGVLSFRHELIAEYFVAEYFFSMTQQKQSAGLSIREDLLEDVGRWSEPVAIWAGLLENPLALAERFGALGRDNSAYVLQALALALVCVGVLWTPPQAEVQRTVVLPPSVEEALSIAVRNRAAREELARVFTRCAEEGGQEVYRSLLPLVMVEGVDDLLTLLDQNIVPDLLFAHLQDAVDDIAYDAQVKRLTRVLSHFGGMVVERATQLSLPSSERSLRLRAAAINILGGTRDVYAVEPLIARLQDPEQFIVSRATNALIRLGPELALTPLLQALELRTPGPFTGSMHYAALMALGRFLEETDVKRQLSLMQCQRTLETMVPVLTSNYQSEPETQKLAREILVRQARNTKGISAQDHRWEKVIESLISFLSAQNEVMARNVVLAFQEIGAVATPHLLAQLKQPSEIVVTRIIEILRVVRDIRALPALLRFVADPSPALQQQASNTLRVYAPDCIPGLIELVLSSEIEEVADRATQILISIGEPVVELVMNALSAVVPGRTRLLVLVLERVHDSRAVSPLITVLQMPQLEPLLAVACIRALSSFPEKRVVAPLSGVLSNTNPLIYEEAIDALGLLGMVALDSLVAALDSEQSSILTLRIQRAILVMKPFPGEALIAALEHASDIQAYHILEIFKKQGTEAARVLVSHLLHKDEQVRDYIYQTLSDMPGPLVVPALLEVLDQVSMRRAVNMLLLQYSESALPPLVDLLGDHDRGDAAAALLPLFGPQMLVPLVSGLDNQRSVARERAQRIIIALVRQSEQPSEILHEIVDLFYPPPPAHAREMLLGILTHELADVSVPILLEGLEDPHLINDVSNAFVLLSRQAAYQNTVLDYLIDALSIEERRRGAATALVKIGAPAVPRVGALITMQDVPVAKAAKDILRDMGVPALSFIWTAHSDSSNAVRRNAALEVFHSMRPEVIKDELIALLVGDKPGDTAMAVALLLERMQDEAKTGYADRVLIPELIDYVRLHGIDNANLRVLALLLLLGEHAIVDHLIQTLDEYPQHAKQLTYVLLLFSTKTQQLLTDVFQDDDASSELRTEIAAVLGMTSAPELITDYVQNISTYGMSATRTSVLFPEQLSIALRALGGLLASGYWNARRLQELRDACQQGDPVRELFNVLLGMRYEPQIARLERDFQDERDAHKKEIYALTARIVGDQKRIQNLEEELEEVRREHGFRGDELHQARRDKEVLNKNLDQVLQQKDVVESELEQMQQEIDSMHADLTRALKDNDALEDELQNMREENKSLYKQNQDLIWQLNHPDRTR
jgi:HEAT repeat protein/ABC-type nitrate/sulfonate/bicarbonate transport system ATPase subunit